MKLLIASDIHGSALFCRQLLDRVEAENPDKLLLLGDLLYHGPRNDLPQGYRPKDVITMLSGLKDRILAVRGNCEAEVDQMVLPFPCMADYALVQAEPDLTLFATHGHLWNPDHLPPLASGAVFLFGHTHIKAVRRVHGVLTLNPGSVSIPKDGSHSYLTYQAGDCCFHPLEGAVLSRVSCRSSVVGDFLGRASPASNPVDWCKKSQIGGQFLSLSWEMKKRVVSPLKMV